MSRAFTQQPTTDADPRARLLWRLPPEMKRQFEQESDRRERTMNAQLTFIVRDWLARHSQ